MFLFHSWADPTTACLATDRGSSPTAAPTAGAHGARLGRGAPRRCSSLTLREAPDQLRAQRASFLLETRAAACGEWLRVVPAAAPLLPDPRAARPLPPAQPQPQLQQLPPHLQRAPAAESRAPCARAAGPGGAATAGSLLLTCIPPASRCPLSLGSRGLAGPGAAETGLEGVRPGGGCGREK